jgi:hypothetical protein
MILDKCPDCGVALGRKHKASRENTYLTREARL